jgi:hypothetical protein
LSCHPKQEEVKFKETEGMQKVPDFRVRTWDSVRHVTLRQQCYTFSTSNLLIRLVLVNLQLLWNVFHKNREISTLTMKKETARPTLPQEATERTKQGETKNETKNKKHTLVRTKVPVSHCSGNINSSMYDSDLTISTSPLTSSAP